jgi:hypothetical protein
MGSLRKQLLSTVFCDVLDGCALFDVNVLSLMVTMHMILHVSDAEIFVISETLYRSLA